MVTRKSKAPVVVESLSTRQRILDTTLTLFKERGIADVSTRDVSLASGLSRSHLYHYFDNWSSLRNAVFAELATAEIEQMSQALSKLKPLPALELFISQLLPAKLDSTWSLWLDAWDEALRDPTFATVYSDSMRNWESLLTQLLENGVQSSQFQCANPSRAAKQLFSLMNGYCADLLLNASPAAHKSAYAEVKEIADLLLRTKR